VDGFEKYYIMKKIYLILIIISNFLPFGEDRWGYSQVSEEWRAFYIGPYNIDFPSSLVADLAGNVYVTGYSRRTSNITDWATVKYNTSGAQQWAARYNWPNVTASLGAYALSIAVDKNENVYVAGIAPINITGFPDKTTTVKYNSSGVQQWAAIFYGQTNNLTDYPGGQSVAVDDSGYVYVTTNSYWPEYGNYDYVTIKYNSSGVEQWYALYNGYNDGRPCRIVLDNEGNVYVTGYSPGDTTHNDIATVKYNSIGRQQWAARYNGPGNGSDSATDMKVDKFGNVYVCGASWGGDSTGYDYVTIKYNSSGVQQWTARYNGTGNGTDVAKSIGVDSLGNVYVTGFTWTGGNSGWDFATIKYNSEGVQQWVAIYDNTYWDYGYSLALDQQGYIYVSGETTIGIRFHYATLKYSPSGVQQWSIISNVNPNGEVPAAIALDSSLNVYVSGSDGNYLTIKYDQLVGVKPSSNLIQKEFKLYQNYPNPFNPTTVIKYSLPKSSLVNISVYDVKGKRIITLLNEMKQAGDYEVNFDGTNLSSGVYFYSIKAEGFYKTKKMILLK